MIATPSRHRTFYRIVGSNLPTLADFTPEVERGRGLLSHDSEAVRLAAGLSAYATLAQGRRKARAYPWLGGYIAVLHVPVAGPVHFERTLLGSRGHHTLWGEPGNLLACVSAIEPVESAG